ncbi:MAG TPA: Spx/MgsR family RNA polymerase-binding regulatory protein [Gammaproteobacteria bacterium]|nr:Spx/MgsR family RNA polymerase-binding regulatory protein [Gammaproteobacteria bacterium]
MIAMWGLKNCDSCRCARQWFDARNIGYVFHDVRDETPDRAHVSHWLDAVGSDVLVNRRSTTWRGLPAAERTRIDSGDPVPVLILYPALLKRPVLEFGNRVLAGFNAAEYERVTWNSR